MLRHRGELLPTLLDLREIGAFPVHDYDLAVWQSRPEDPCWPVAKCEICRDSGGELTVRLHAQQRLQWNYLEQHLSGDRVWDAIDSWKQAMAEDMRARLDLLELSASRDR